MRETEIIIENSLIKLACLEYENGSTTDEFLSSYYSENIDENSDVTDVTLKADLISAFSELAEATTDEKNRLDALK